MNHFHHINNVRRNFVSIPFQDEVIKNVGERTLKTEYYVVMFIKLEKPVHFFMNQAFTSKYPSSMVRKIFVVIVYPYPGHLKGQ